MAGLKSLIKLPQPIKTSAITAGYTAGGMLANRFVSSRLSDMLNVSDVNVRLGLRLASGVGIGVLAFQLAKKKDVATAMTIGALADVLVEVWNGFAPEQLRLSGDLGLVYAEHPSLDRTFPVGSALPQSPGVSQFSGDGLSGQYLEVAQMAG